MSRASKNEAGSVDEQPGVLGPHNGFLLDAAARAHLWKLIHIWLPDIGLPVRPWATVFLDLALQLSNHMKAASDTMTHQLTIVTMPLVVHTEETGKPQWSKFALDPNENEEGWDGGNDEAVVLDGSILPLSRYWSITGSISLQGVPASKGPLVRTLLVVILHVVGNLKLESHVLHDHHIITHSSFATTAPLSPAYHGISSKQHKNHNNHQQPVHQRFIPSPSSLKQWLLKKSIFKYMDGKPNGPALLSKDYSAQSSSTSTVLGAFLSTKAPQSPANRFEKIYRQLHAACVSSSPGAVFGVPKPIEQLYYEEKLGSFDEDTHLATPTKVLHHLFPKGSSKTTTTASTSDSSDQSESSRIGLEYLIVDILTLHTFIELQNITFSYMRAPATDAYKPCMDPILCRIDYYNEDRKSRFPDTTLGQFLRMLYARRDFKCNNHYPHHDNETASVHSKHDDNDSDDDDASIKKEWCQHAMMDHCIRFSFTQRRVEVRMTLAKSTFPGNKILMWATCGQCGAATPKVPMSAATEHYSFGKYLELHFSNDRLLLLPPTLCAHTMSSLSVPICHFQIDTLKMTLTTMTIQPYVLCPPKPRFRYPTPLDSGGSGKKSNDGLSSTWRIEIEEELAQHFMAVLNHLDMIGQYIRGEPSLPNPEHQSLQLQQLRQNVLSDYRDWEELLQQTTDVELNSLRRAFVVMTAAALEELGRWQDEQFPELIASCNYEGPGYTQPSTKIYVMPGAPVLVRQDEPSSIIAYTLSCRNYRLEIEMNDDTKTLIDVDANKDLALSTDMEEEAPLPDPKETDYYYSLLERNLVVQGESKLVSSRRIFIQRVTDSPAAVNRTSGQEPTMHVDNHHHLHPHCRHHYHPWFHPHHHHHHSRPSLPSEWVVANVNSRDVFFRQEEGRTTCAKRVLTNTTTLSVPKRTIEVKFRSTFHPKIDQGERTKVNVGSKNTSNSIPHITHRFAHNSTEFTCIAYYADEFEELRENCGVDKLIIESLSRCAPWLTTGGKSKSKFYKTKDERFVVKEMLSSWNIGELEAFLDIAPAYLEYMKHTIKTCTTLTKIFGVYTLKMAVDGKTLWTMDVMVMEHLFYGRRITETFDFKGIRDRMAPDSCSTLWDGDWMHGTRRLDDGVVTEHSRRLTDESIRNDIKFLDRHNIMDYSLLVGIDGDQKEIAVGIVDFIGAYTWYKKIESKSKTTLKPQRRVTILPPDQYKVRFYNEVSQYFVPIPGKYDRVQRPEPKNLPFIGLLGMQ